MQELPFTNDPAQSFTVPLGEAKFLIEAQWNDTAGFWTFNLTAVPAGTRLVSGVPILIGQDMLAPYALGIGGLVATDTYGKGIDAGAEDLGDRVTVTWLSEEELAAIVASALPPQETVAATTSTAGTVTAANFTPFSLGSTMKLWARPDRGLTLSGSNVTNWADYSGNGNDLTATGSIPITGTINGRSAMALPGGTAGFFNTVKNVVPSGSARTVFVVAKATSEFGGPLFMCQRTSGVRAVYFAGGSGHPFAGGIYTNGVDGTRNATISPPTLTGVPLIFEYTCSAAPAPVVMRINGVLQSVTQTNPCDPETGSPGFSVGNGEGGTNYLGAIGDVIVCDTVLPAATLALTRNWLASWYNGIPVS